MRRAVLGAAAAVLLATACSGGGRPHAATPRKKPDPGSARAGDAAVAAYQPTGKLVADNGFRPERDGFSFENYGNDDPPDVANLGPDEMRKLFGDKVCTNLASGRCVLTPPAAQWMRQVNKSADGGHCQGLSVLSDLLWKRVEQPATYGAPTTPGLKLEGNAPLQREIAYAFAYQDLDAYDAAIINGTPSQILDELIQVLRPGNDETYTLGIYMRGFEGGHAVTPYAVEDNGGGVFHVLIYDNNYPGVTRAITIDRNKDAWSYEASTNPEEASDHYEGDAESGTLDLEPTSPGEGVQPCPFCGDLTPTEGAATSDTPDVDQIWLDGSDVDHAHLLITDPSGHRIGFVDGKFVNDMPGARAAFGKASRNWAEVIEPDYYVPDGVDYTITVDGSGLEEEDDTTVGVIAPAWDATVDDLAIVPGEKATFAVSSDVTKVTFSSNRAQTPTIDVGWSDDVDYDFTVSNVALRGGGVLAIGLPTGAGDLVLTNTPAATVDLSFERTDDDTDETFTHNRIRFASGDTAVFHYGDFTKHDDPVALDVTRAGATQTVQLTNQER